MAPSFLKRIVVGLLVCVSMLPAVVFAYTSPGAPDGYVNDFAQILTVDEHGRLESMMEAYASRTSREIAIVTISTLGGDTIEQYAASLFQEWGIGKKTEDNGVLLLVAPQDRKLRIEVGYGLESILTDAKSAGVINGTLPLFEQKKYALALEQVANGIELILDQAVQNPSVISVPEEKPLTKSAVFGLIVVFALSFLVIQFVFGLVLGIMSYLFSLVIHLLTGQPLPKFKRFFSGMGRGFFWGRGGGRFGGGGGFGGGFGGGRSGGGGASGGW